MRYTVATRGSTHQNVREESHNPSWIREPVFRTREPSFGVGPVKCVFHYDIHMKNETDDHKLEDDHLARAIHRFNPKHNPTSNYYSNS
jgi:hypothetical protein